MLNLQSFPTIRYRLGNIETAFHANFVARKHIPQLFDDHRLALWTRGQRRFEKQCRLIFHFTGCDQCDNDGKARGGNKRHCTPSVPYCFRNGIWDRAACRRRRLSFVRGWHQRPGTSRRRTNNCHHQKWNTGRNKQWTGFASFRASACLLPYAVSKHTIR